MIIMTTIWPVEPITELTAEMEALLHESIGAVSPDVASDVARVRADLAAGAIYGAVVQGEAEPVGLALWRLGYPISGCVAVNICYVIADAPQAAADALVGYLWDTLAADPAVDMLGVRVRGEQLTVRAALARQEAVVFARSMLVCNLMEVKLPDVTLPAGYALAPWTDAHQAQIEAIAVDAVRDSIDAVAVPDASAENLALTLRQLREGTYPHLGPFIAAASLVVTAPDGEVAGYIACADAGTMGFVADVAVDRAHRRRGLGRLLVVRAMEALVANQYPMVGLAVTEGNPAQTLYESLGYTAMQRGEIATWWRDGRQLAWAAG
jgi:ribosomal protein S18 acetylase RimI-like enzyme